MASEEDSQLVFWANRTPFGALSGQILNFWEGKKRRKKEEKGNKGDFPIRLVIQRYSSLSVFWMSPGQLSRPVFVSFMRMNSSRGTFDNKIIEYT
jgi:hypothetical protein